MLGLALSGGGVKSAAQLGIVKALHENDIYPDIYVGTSGGSIVASMLSCYVSIDDCLKTFTEASKHIIDPAIKHILTGAFTSSYIEGFVKGDRLEKSLNKLVGNYKMSDVPKPLGIVTTDIDTGEEVIFHNGFYNASTKNKLNADYINYDDYILQDFGEERITDIVRASCSLPGVFIPKSIGGHDGDTHPVSGMSMPNLLIGRRLVDGGITDNLPSDIAKYLGADKIISIDLGYSGFTDTRGLIDILQMSLNVLMRRSVKDNEGSFGFYMNPKVYDIHVLDTDRIQECFYRGYEYGKLMIPDIIKYLNAKK